VLKVNVTDEPVVMAGAESVKVVPLIEATTVPTAIPVPDTNCPTAIDPFEADNVTEVLPAVIVDADWVVAAEIDANVFQVPPFQLIEASAI